MMALETGTILQARYRYRLVRRLGHGGFGSVYQAHCLDREAGGREDTPPQEVAIKVLGSSRHADAMTTMKRELAALRRVRHSRIPALYDGSLEGEVAFVVMAYYPAGSLADARPWIGRLDVDQTWRLVGDLLSALSAAHRASVLHLDVKPSNVLLDGHGGFVLTDFGVAHTSLMSKGLLIQGQIPIGLGTHGYGASAPPPGRPSPASTSTSARRSCVAPKTALCTACQPSRKCGPTARRPSRRW